MSDETDILAWLRHEERSWDDNFGPGGGDIFKLPADEIERLRAEVATLMDGMERAWGIIANGRAWDPVHHDEWEAAKFAWRDDHWHPSLARNVSVDAPEQGDDR